MRTFLLGLLMALLVASAAQAEDKKGDANWPVGEKPSKPLTGVWEYKDPYSASADDLSTPNRTQDEILDWAQQRAAEALSFSKDNMDKKLEELKKAFVLQGWQEYAAYIRDSDVMNRVRGGYSVVTIVNGDPLILNSGTAGTQSYHWLVELPLMVTLSSVGLSGDVEPHSGGSFRLLMQIGRVAQKSGIDGLAIESWRVRAKAAVEKPGETVQPKPPQ